VMKALRAKIIGATTSQQVHHSLNAITLHLNFTFRCGKEYLIKTENHQVCS